MDPVNEFLTQKSAETQEHVENEGGGFAAPGAFGVDAPPPAVPPTIRGKSVPIAIPAPVEGARLDPAKTALESLPAELKGNVIPLLEGMLDLLTTIKQKKETRARFKKPATNPTTGAVLRNEAGEPKPFIPNSLRDKCPLKASKHTNDDPRMQMLLKEGEDLYYQWQLTGAKQAEKIAQLEIDIRQEELRHKSYDLALMLASSYVTIKAVMDEGLPSEIALTEEQLTDKSVFEALKTLKKSHCGALWMEDGDKIAEDFAKYRVKFDDSAIETKLKEEEEALLDTDSSDYIKPVSDTVATLLPLLTTKLWANEEAKEKKRKISAALKKLLKPKAMAKANQDVEMALDTADANAPNENLLNVIRKTTKEEVGREVQHIKRNLRKNSLGDDKTQASTPRKSGQESNADSKSSSTKSRRKSKTKSGGKQQKPKSALKKKEKGKVKFKTGTKEGTPNKPTTAGNAGRGGRGAASKGGRGRGANKRKKDP